jgi:hypothetical protein
MKKILGIIIGSLLYLSLFAQDRAVVPFSDDFDPVSGGPIELKNNPWIAEHNYSGSLPFCLPSFLKTTEDAYSGTYSLKIFNNYNEDADKGEVHPVFSHRIMDATLMLDLSNEGRFIFEGAWKGVNIQNSHWDDENNGIFISDDDGQSYVEIVDLSGTGEWNFFRLNLSLLADQYHFQLNNKMRIKFQYMCISKKTPSGYSSVKSLLIDDISVFDVSNDSPGIGDSGYKVVYFYDQAGNRTGRDYVEIVLQKKSASKEKTEPEPFIEPNGEDEIIIYPNPTKGFLRVKIKGTNEAINYTYDLYDLQGNLLLKGEVKTYGEFPLNMNNLTSGMYMLILKSPQSVLKYKIIKE